MFDTEELENSILGLPERVEAAVMAYGNTVAKAMEAEAKKGRPWTDRTGHARQQLTGYCEKSESGVRIYLAHGVSYGPDLEFKHEKRYAIVYPTLRRMGPKALKGLRGILGRA